MTLTGKILFILLLVQAVSGSTEHAFAQQQPGHGRPNDYYFSSEILKLPKKENYLIYSQLSFIGDYKKALQYADSNAVRFGVVTREDSLYLRKFKPVSAHKYISKRATKERIVILNEAHHNPRHRVFTLSLLRDLYD